MVVAERDFPVTGQSTGTDKIHNNTRGIGGRDKDQLVLGARLDRVTVCPQETKLWSFMSSRGSSSSRPVNHRSVVVGNNWTGSGSGAVVTGHIDLNGLYFS